MFVKEIVIFDTSVPYAAGKMFTRRRLSKISSVNEFCENWETFLKKKEKEKGKVLKWSKNVPYSY